MRRRGANDTLPTAAGSPPAGGAYSGYPASGSAASGGGAYAGYGGASAASPGYGSGSGSGYGGYGGYGGGAAGGGGGGGNGYSSSMMSADDKYSKKKDSGMGLWQTLTAAFCASTLVLSMSTLHYRARYLHLGSEHTFHRDRSRRQVEDLVGHRDALKGHLDTADQRLQSLDTQIEEIASHNEALKREVDDHREGKDGLFERVHNREGALTDRIRKMSRLISRESHRAMWERFGPGPHVVEMQFELPFDRAYPNVPENPKVLINLYGAAMPHSTHLFMEQVAHMLWDGTAFHVNAMHVLQAGATPGGEVQEDKLGPFHQLELDTVTFQEYSADYPHKPYTLGFAGRPGGPDFYVNKIDNTEVNGPGGQGHHHVEEEADPCFGEIDEGSRHIIDRIFALPAGTEMMLLTRPLHILQARIVGFKHHHKHSKMIQDTARTMKAGRNDNVEAGKKQELPSQWGRPPKPAPPGHTAAAEKDAEAARAAGAKAEPVPVVDYYDDDDEYNSAIDEGYDDDDSGAADDDYVPPPKNEKKKHQRQTLEVRGEDYDDDFVEPPRGERADARDPDPGRHRHHHNGQRRDSGGEKPRRRKKDRESF